MNKHLDVARASCESDMLVIVDDAAFDPEIAAVLFIFCLKSNRSVLPEPFEC